MPKVLIRLDRELSDEALRALPLQLAYERSMSTTLVGDAGGQEGLESLLSLFAALEIPVTELVALPDEPSNGVAHPG